MFEQRILCHKLPNSFNPIIIDTREVESINKRNKMIQHLKREMLNVELAPYKFKIQNYKYLYEQQLDTDVSKNYKPSFDNFLSCLFYILFDFFPIFG